ncbi:hypothetical protein D3C72_1879450 [compost metagenome]
MARPGSGLTLLARQQPPHPVFATGIAEQHLAVGRDDDQAKGESLQHLRRELTEHGDVQRALAQAQCLTQVRDGPA